MRQGWRVLSVTLLLLAVALSGCVRMPWSHAPAPEEDLSRYPTRTEAEFVAAYRLVPPIAGATELAREVLPYSFRVRLSAPGRPLHPATGPGASMPMPISLARPFQHCCSSCDPGSFTSPHLEGT